MLWKDMYKHEFRLQQHAKKFHSHNSKTVYQRWSVMSIIRKQKWYIYFPFWDVIECHRMKIYNQFLVYMFEFIILVLLVLGVFNSYIYSYSWHNLEFKCTTVQLHIIRQNWGFIVWILSRSSKLIGRSSQDILTHFPVMTEYKISPNGYLVYNAI